MRGSPEYSAELAKLTSVLERLLAGELGVIEASRWVSRARHALGVDDNDLFLPFVGIDSETDSFPLGPVRELWAADALVRHDAERAVVEEQSLGFARQAAERLLLAIRADEL
jgi:hypothetical protein